VLRSVEGRDSHLAGGGGVTEFEQLMDESELSVWRESAQEIDIAEVVLSERCWDVVWLAQHKPLFTHDHGDNFDVKDLFV